MATFGVTRRGAALMAVISHRVEWQAGAVNGLGAVSRKRPRNDVNAEEGPTGAVQLVRQAREVRERIRVRDQAPVRVACRPIPIGQ